MKSSIHKKILHEKSFENSVFFSHPHCVCIMAAPGPAYRPFDPEKTIFKDVSKINPTLLQDVVNCYKKKKIVCKACFFRNRGQEVVVSNNRPCHQCRESETVLVIPASRMCRNFSNSKSVVISQPPRLLMNALNAHKPFQYCRNSSHSVCYEQSCGKDVKYAHSIEELVIWTIERAMSKWEGG